MDATRKIAIHICKMLRKGPIFGVFEYNENRWVRPPLGEAMKISPDANFLKAWAQKCGMKVEHVDQYNDPKVEA
jgi:hypothetical protein